MLDSKSRFQFLRWMTASDKDTLGIRLNQRSFKGNINLKVTKLVLDIVKTNFLMNLKMNLKMNLETWNLDQKCRTMSSLKCWEQISDFLLFFRKNSHFWHKNYFGQKFDRSLPFSKKKSKDEKFTPNILSVWLCIFGLNCMSLSSFLKEMIYFHRFYLVKAWKND